MFFSLQEEIVRKRLKDIAPPVQEGEEQQIPQKSMNQNDQSVLCLLCCDTTEMT